MIQLSPTTTRLLPDLLRSPVQVPVETSVPESWSYTGLELGPSKQKWLNQSIFTCLHFLLGLFRDSSSAVYPGLCLMDGSCSFPHFSATFQTVCSCLILLLNEVFLLLSYQYGEPFFYFLWVPHILEARIHIPLMHPPLSNKSNQLLSSKDSSPVGFYHICLPFLIPLTQF